MKYKSLLITTILLTIVTIAFYYNEVNPVIENNKNPNNFSTSTLSINLETTAGSGVYEEATNSLWPSEGFTFNAELSKCENGSELSWDEENKKVMVSSNKSDRCYVYFDKEPETFANHIISLYTTQGANNLYHHDGTLENGIDDGSYRYAGSYETTQNWVCFGTNSDTCDDEHLYRIIGVFDSVIIDDAGNATIKTEQKVKLIKAYEGTQASIGTTPHYNSYKNATYYKGKLDPTPGYYWSGSSSNTSNNWLTSTLNTNILNGTYLSTLGTDWNSKIAMTEWKIGGNTYANISSQNAATAYQNEVVNSATNIVSNPKHNAKVGLMYASDYGFAASPANWSTILGAGGYGNDTNRNNNWLFMGIYDWTISPNVNDLYVAFRVDYGGYVYGANVNNSYGVRPTFYLNSNVMLVGGSGTESDPYRIA